MKDSLIQDLPRRCPIGKVGISVVTLDQVLSLLNGRVRERRPTYVCVANVEATVLSQRDAEFCSIQNQSFLTVPDSTPLIWYARLVGERGMERVSGPDLMIEVLKRSSLHKYTHYFYGDTVETLQKMRVAVQERFPGTPILGMHSPPFRPLSNGDLEAMVAEINRLQPTFVWIALGCPKQERWMGRVFPQIESSILVGVGAAFRFLIGEYRHPPKVVQACGLEGIYWRGLKYPLQGAKWYGYHIPAYGTLLLHGLAKRFVGSL